MPSLCQTCGAEIVPGRGVCPHCLRPTEAAFTRPALSESEEVVSYELDDLDAAARAESAEALAAAAVPYRWEPGLVLAVATPDEARVDAIFDALDDAAEAAEQEPEVADDALPAAAEAWGEGEDAFAALGDLFDAADRLLHAPTSAGAAGELRAAGQRVRSSAPPYGFSAVLWQTAGQLSQQLESLLAGGASDDEVRAGAEALRDVLAEHV